MKTLLLVLFLVAISATTTWAQDDLAILARLEALTRQQIKTADSLIWDLFQSASASSNVNFAHSYPYRLIHGSMAFLKVTETPARNAGWLWSQNTHDKMLSGGISQEELVYQQVMVDTGLVRDIVGHYQQTLLYRDGKFWLVEQVWFSDSDQSNLKSTVIIIFFVSISVILIVALLMLTRRLRSLDNQLGKVSKVT